MTSSINARLMSDFINSKKVYNTGRADHLYLLRRSEVVAYLEENAGLMVLVKSPRMFTWFGMTKYGCYLNFRSGIWRWKLDEKNENIFMNLLNVVANQELLEQYKQQRLLKKL